MLCGRGSTPTRIQPVAPKIGTKKMAVCAVAAEWRSMPLTECRQEAHIWVLDLILETIMGIFPKL